MTDQKSIENNNHGFEVTQRQYEYATTHFPWCVAHRHDCYRGVRTFFIKTWNAPASVRNAIQKFITKNP